MARRKRERLNLDDLTSLPPVIHGFRDTCLEDRWLATFLGVSRTLVYYWMNNERPIPQHVIFVMTQILHIWIDQLRWFVVIEDWPDEKRQIIVECRHHGIQWLCRQRRLNSCLDSAVKDKAWERASKFWLERIASKKQVRIERQLSGIDPNTKTLDWDYVFVEHAGMKTPYVIYAFRAIKLEAEWLAYFLDVDEERAYAWSKGLEEIPLYMRFVMSHLLSFLMKRVRGQAHNAKSSKELEYCEGIIHEASRFALVQIAENIATQDCLRNSALRKAHQYWKEHVACEKPMPTKLLQDYSDKLHNMFGRNPTEGLPQEFDKAAAMTSAA